MSQKTFKIINGNSYEELKKIPDNYFDSVVTDPPYGLGKEPNANEMLKAWIETGFLEVKGSGFMGKEWDAFVPQPLFWKEVFRVLKHGGHVVAFYGTRTYDWGVMAMRLAGFEIRDGLQWIYGSGFPKSHNISKAIDKMYGAEREVVGKSDYTMPKADNSMGENSYGISGGKLANGTTAERITADITTPSTEDAKQWDGWGSALKPAVEPIVLARKPLEKGLSIAENVLKWGTGAINIDRCRVGTSDNLNGGAYAKNGKERELMWGVEANNSWRRDKGLEFEQPNGRFPANLLMSHHPDCCFNGTKKVKAIKGGCKFESAFFKGGESNFTKDGGIGDENGEETIEDWTCHEDCPIKIMDEQSGETKGTIRKPNGNPILNVKNGWNDNSMIDNTIRGHNDSGGASRFFYCAKTSKSERNFGLNGFEEKRKSAYGYDLGLGNAGEGMFKDRNTLKLNIHPTVKPTKLMQYLARLITPPNGKVLDPFNGSGTTGVACVLEGFDYIGIELDAEYCKISEARINAWNEVEEYEDYKKIIENQEEEKEYKPTQMNLFDEEF